MLSQVKEYETRLLDIGAEMKDMQQRYQETGIELTQTQHELARQINTNSAEIDHFNSSVNHLEQRLQSSTDQLHAAHRDIDSLKAQLAEAVNKASAAERLE